MSPDFGNNPIKAKMHEAEQLRVHPMLVIGGRDQDTGVVVVKARIRKARSSRWKWWRTFWRRFGHGEPDLEIIRAKRTYLNLLGLLGGDTPFSLKASMAKL